MIKSWRHIVCQIFLGSLILSPACTRTEIQSNDPVDTNSRIGLSEDYKEQSRNWSRWLFIDGKQRLFAVEKSMGKTLGFIYTPEPAADTSMWVPQQSNIDNAEKAISEYIKINPPHSDINFHETQSESIRQYFGASYNGRRYIYINAISSDYNSSDTQYPRNFKLTLDGGPSNFKAAYDIETGSLIWVSYNQYA